MWVAKTFSFLEKSVVTKITTNVFLIDFLREVDLFGPSCKFKIWWWNKYKGSFAIQIKNYFNEGSKLKVMFCRVEEWFRVIKFRIIFQKN